MTHARRRSRCAEPCSPCNIPNSEVLCATSFCCSLRCVVQYEYIACVCEMFAHSLLIRVTCLHVPPAFKCMNKIFRGIVVVTPSKPPSLPANNFCLYPPPVLRCFWKDPLMTPTIPLQAFSLLPPPHPPLPPKILIIHQWIHACTGKGFTLQYGKRLYFTAPYK